MSYNDPVIVTIGLFVGAIVTLRVFFSLWAPIHRRLAGDPLHLTKSIHVDALKNKTLDIHLKSHTVLEGALLIGYCTTHTEAPYAFKQLLMLRLSDETTAYVRIEEIEYLHERRRAA